MELREASYDDRLVVGFKKYRIGGNLYPIFQDPISYPTFLGVRNKGQFLMVTFIWKICHLTSCKSSYLNQFFRMDKRIIIHNL